jgi:thioredoxin reductase
MARRLTDKVTIYTNGAEDVAATVTDLLANDKGGRAGEITVDNRRLVRLQRGCAHPSEIVIGFEDGSAETHGFLVHQPHMTIAGPFAKQLELELTPTGDIKSTPPFYETSMPGVFAVGDCATPLKAVSQALAMGAFAAAGIVFQLGAELAKIG